KRTRSTCKSRSPPYANAAKTSGETLLSLIEEILDFSKIEAGKLDLEARPSRSRRWWKKQWSLWLRAHKRRG
ncbi:MAG: hypothetical protein WB614_01215, partial [Pseudolabrys sp.]